MSSRRSLRILSFPALLLSSGKTVEDLAKEKGISETQLQQRVLADIREKLSQVVKDGKITQDRADQMYQRLKEGISTGRWLQGQRPKTP